MDSVFRCALLVFKPQQSQIHRLKIRFPPNTFRYGQEKISSVTVQKGLLISPEIPRRQFEGLEQLSTF